MDQETFLLAFFSNAVRAVVWGVVVIWALYILRPVLLAAVGA